jgi:predicted TIM-barrel fold metal-dependent hydrolase
MTGVMRAMLALLTSVGLAQPQPYSAPVVDHHQHMWSPTIAERTPGTSALNARDLVRLLDAAGIQRAAVFSLAYQWGNPNRPAVDDEYAKVQAENDWTSREVAQFPDRLRAFCSINPLKEYARREIDRCANDPQLRRGLKLHFGNSDVDLTNAAHLNQVRDVFRAANGHSMAIAVHLRSSVNQKRPFGAASARAFLEDVLPMAPDVTVQVAHLAGAGGYDDPAIDEALGVLADAVAKKDPRVARVYFDISGVILPGRWEKSADRIVARVRQLGLDRVLYGSDGGPNPMGAPTARLADFRKLPLTDAEHRALAGNIAPYMK